MTAEMWTILAAAIMLAAAILFGQYAIRREIGALQERMGAANQRSREAEHRAMLRDVLLVEAAAFSDRAREMRSRLRSSVDSVEMDPG